MIKKLIRSFHYASDGITYTIATQRNMKIHVAISLVVLLLGMWLHFHMNDVITVLILIGIVLSAEMINTAIETTVDLVTKEIHPLAKIAKDTSAGAVLILAIISMIVGIGIISPYFLNFYTHHFQQINSSNEGFYLFAATFLILVTFIVKSYWRKQKSIQLAPSIFIGMLMIQFACLSLSLLVISIIYAVVFLLPYLVWLLKKNEYSGFGLLQNSLISIVGYYLLVWFFY